MRKYTIAIIACILPAILLGTVLASSTLQPSSQATPSVSASVHFTNMKVWYVGGTNPVFNTVLARVQAFAPGLLAKLDPSTLTASDQLPISQTATSMVLFDSDYLNAHSGDAQVQRILKTGLAGVQLVAIGGSTSKFFEMLNTNGVHPLFANPDGTLRNPDLLNAPEVGFALKTQATADGRLVSYPSILISNSSDPNDLTNALETWSAK